MLGIVFPFLIRIPTRRRLLMNRLNASMEEIARELLANTREESVGEGKMEKSIIELLSECDTSIWVEYPYVPVLSQGRGQ